MKKHMNTIVTGGSQGLGAAIARLFAANGHRVFINCARGVDKASAVAAEINAAGGLAEVFQCDVGSEHEVKEKFGDLDRACGGIDVLINNARLDPYRRTAECSDGDWFDQTMRVNLKGAYLPALALIDGMKSRNFGRIINVSSVWAFRAAPLRLIPYAMSKAAMHAMTRGFAQEGAPFNVTVNTVAPGLIMTENVNGRLSAEQLAAETAGVPLGRGASPEEVARVILNTVNSAFITGETVNVNGGVYMP